jgi:long-chain fatty acid transport protein
MQRSLVIAAAAAVLYGGAAHAQGSAVDQQSACMAGRAAAGIALPCDDGSAVFYSPAALAELPSAVSAGLAIVRSSNVFRYDPGFVRGGQPDRVERPAATIPVPQAYVNYRINPRLAAGIGVLAPYGLGLEWPVCPVEDPRCAGPNFEGRFTGYDNALRGLYIQPTVAYQVVPGRFSLGAGLDYVRASLEVNRRLFGPAPLGLGNTEIGDVRLEGSGTTFTYHLGGLVRFDEGTTLGVRYLGSAAVDLAGDAAFTQIMLGNPALDAQIGAVFPRDQGVATTIEFPAQLVVGVATAATDRLNLMADWQRTYWSSFDAFDIDFETAPDEVLALDYRDVNTFRLAGEFAATPAVAVRAGFRYNEAATPRATPLLPEGERNVFSLGLGYRVSPALSTDFSFQHIVQPDRAGPVVPGGERAGIYESRGFVFNFTLAYRFGGIAAIR